MNDSYKQMWYDTNTPAMTQICHNNMYNDTIVQFLKQRVHILAFAQIYIKTIHQ